MENMNNFNAKSYITSENGKKSIPFEAKVLWFREVYPLGVMDVSFQIIGGNVIATAKIKPEGGEEPVITWSTCERISALDSVSIAEDVENLQEKALDKALELAGFGIEITAETMKNDAEEGETETSEEPEAPVKKKRHRRTKAEMEAARKAEAEAKAEEDAEDEEPETDENSAEETESSGEETTESTPAEEPETSENKNPVDGKPLDIDEITFDYDGEEDDIQNLMNMVSFEEAAEEAEESDEKVDEATEDGVDNALEEALSTVVSTVANAHPRLKQFDGMTLKEVLDKHKDACEVFVRERIIPQMSPETVEASKIILKSRM